MPAAEALELRDLHHPETIFIVHVGVDPLHGNPAAAFDAERPLVGDVVHPLIDGCDATIAFGFLIGVGLSRGSCRLLFRRVDVHRCCAAITEADGFQPLCQRRRTNPGPFGELTAPGWWHHSLTGLHRVLPPAVTQAQQIGIAAFGDAVVSAEGAGTVMDAADEGDVIGDGSFHLEAEVVEKLGIVLPECFFVEADAAVVTHAFHDTDIQPGLKPDPCPDAEDPFTEALGRKLRVGLGLVEFTASLLLGDVAEQVGLHLNGQGTRAEDPFLETHPQHGLRSHATVEHEGVPEGGVDHLPAPCRHGPGMGLPVWTRREHRWAGHGCQLLRDGRRISEGQLVSGAGVVEVDNSVDVLKNALIEGQVVAES